MAKLPAINFYPGDWLRDSVAGCSLAAQGLWLRLMIIMHDSDRYGYLCQNGVAIPLDQLSRRTGCSSLDEFTTLLTELDSAGVPGRTNDNIIFSRRMVRDAEARAKDAERKRKERGSNGVSGACPDSVRSLSGESHNASSVSSSISKRSIFLNINNKDKKPTFLDFDEEQIRQIRIEIAKTKNHKLMSDANEVAFRELMNRVREYVKKNKVVNAFGYALVAARNGNGFAA